MFDIISIIIVFIVIVFSMVLHEMAHAYTAYWLGDDTAKSQGRLSPNPLVHIDPMMSIVLPLLLFIMGVPIFGGAKPVPINTRNLKGGVWGMALVAIAGPLMNFVLAFVSFLIGHFTGLLYDPGYAGVFFKQLLTANLGFMIFNLLPLPPLDGSRVIYAIAPNGVRRVMEKLESTFGIVLIYTLILVLGTAFSYLMTFTMLQIVKFFYFIVVGGA